MQIFAIISAYTIRGEEIEELYEQTYLVEIKIIQRDTAAAAREDCRYFWCLYIHGGIIK